MKVIPSHAGVINDRVGEGLETAWATGTMSDAVTVPFTIFFKRVSYTTYNTLKL